MDQNELQKRVLQAAGLAEEAQQVTRAGAKALYEQVEKLRNLQDAIEAGTSKAAANAATEAIRFAGADLKSEAVSAITRITHEHGQKVAVMAADARAAAEAASKALEAAQEAQQGVKWGLLLGVTGVALAVGVLLGVLITRI